jgi:hypothetical protein
MIYVPINEPDGVEWGSGNPYVTALGHWKDWCKAQGLTYLSAGSEIESIEPGQWCIKSYSRAAKVLSEAAGNHWYVRYPRRVVCFHEQDHKIAVLFKLRWG